MLWIKRDYRPYCTEYYGCPRSPSNSARVCLSAGKSLFTCTLDFFVDSLLQLSSVLSDIEIHAIKTGMLHDTDVILAIMQTLKGHYTGTKMPPIVCDPVCVSTSGHTLLQPGAIGALINDVFPISTLITPNKAEAELLVSSKYPGFTISSLEGMITAATRLAEYGSACLVKGGHITASLQDVERVIKTNPQVSVVKDELLEENMEILQVGDDGLRSPRLVVDVLDLGGDLTLFVRPFIVSENTHGTGCTLSSAIASGLGRGQDCQSFSVFVVGIKSNL